MSKKKEQVKYNPKYSDLKRLRKLKNALVGKSIFWLTIVYIFFVTVMFGCVVFGGALDTKDFISDDGNLVAMFVCCGSFMSLFPFAVNQVMPMTAEDSAKQRGALKGCPSVADALIMMPVKKVDAVKLSFRYYLVPLMLDAAIIVVSNIYCMIFPEFEIAKGSVAATTFFLGLMMFLMYLAFFNQKFKEALRAILVVAGIGFYVVWFGTMIGFLDKFFAIKFVISFAGIPSIVFIVLVVVAIILIQKLYTEKEVVKTAWIDA